MTFQIRYSHRARKEYKELILYVLQNFGFKKAAQVDSLFEKLIFQISVNPKMYPLFDKNRNIRRCVISRQTSLFYRIKNKNVELVSFRNNLMNPNKISFD